MDSKFTWKATIKFEGTVTQFNEMTAQLEKMQQVELEIPEWDLRPGHLAGCSPIPLDNLVGSNFINEIIVDMPRIQMKFVKDIYGGMRSPHLHIDNDVVLLTHEKFKAFVGRVAQQIGQRRADASRDYIEVLNPINNLFPVAQIGLQAPVLTELSEKKASKK